MGQAAVGRKEEGRADLFNACGEFSCPCEILIHLQSELNGNSWALASFIQPFLDLLDAGSPQTP